MSPFRFTRLQGTFVALYFFASFASAGAAESVLLKPKVDAPAEHYVEIETDAVQKMAGPDGKPMEIKARSVFGLMQKTTPKGDGVEITATLDRMFGFMAFTPTMQSLYDTDDPDFEEASPMHKEAFGPILNMPIKFTLDGQGVATGTEGGEAIRKKLLDLGDQNYVAKSIAEGEFSDSQIKSQIGEVAVILFPHREVKVGETWKKTQKDDYPQVGKVIANYDCKLERIEKADGRDVAVVSFKGTVVKDAEEKPAKDQRLGKIDMRFDGEATFDIEQGRFVVIQREAKGTIEVPPWWTKEPKAPLMKIENESKHNYTVASATERQKQKAAITQRIADAKAKQEAEEAAAMAGPVEPVTPENAPVPWLQWGGTNRDFRSEATGLANRWPKGGPPKLWERPLGDGFSMVLCEGDVLYTTYSLRDKADAYKGDEVVVAMDAKSGKTIWEHKYSAPWPKNFQMEFGAGPYSTPLVVGDRLFTIGCTAKFLCLDKKTGSVIWSKDLDKEYKANLQMRGYGSSPLAYKGNIVLPVSKEKDHAIMAFKQSDGSVAWKGGDFDMGYPSLVVIDPEGTEQIVAFTTKAVLGLDPTNGSTQWSVDHPTQWGGNIATPVWWGEDDHLFISSAYGMGSRGVKVEKAGSQITAKEVWYNPKMKIQHADAVRVGEWVYGSSSDMGPAILACVNAKTGEFGWRQRGIAKATLVYADGKLIVLDEDGSLYLVKADPTKYRLLGKMTGVCKKTAWTVPTLVGRTLYLRDREKVVALDLGTGKGSM